MKKEKHRTLGTILNVSESKTNPNCASILLGTLDGKTCFKAFDNNKRNALKRKKGDKVIIDWYVSGTAKEFNKVDIIWDIKAVRDGLEVDSNIKDAIQKELEERKQSMIISGKISSLKNSRGMSSKKSEEVAFTVKPKRGEKVSYCYAPSNFTQSKWFQKGNYIKLEVSPMGEVNNHKAYSVITLWEK